MWNGLVGKSYKISEFIMKISLLQILWIFFTILGLGLLGVIPATIGLFTVIRKWQMNQDVDISMFRVYWNTFRKEFLKANLIGIILFVIGYLLYVNFTIIRSTTEGFLNIVLLIAIFILSVLFLIVIINIFPIYVHFDLKLLQYFSLSFLLGISFPIHTLIAAGGVYGLYQLFLWIPGLIPFFSVSLPAYFLIWLSLHIFAKVEENFKPVM